MLRLSLRAAGWVVLAVTFGLAHGLIQGWLNPNPFGIDAGAAIALRHVSFASGFMIAGVFFVAFGGASVTPKD